MLKLNASYSKKVPAESEYSSQQYHCQIEVELPDGLNPQQLQDDVCQILGSRRTNGIDESLFCWLDVRNEIDREIERRLVNAED